MSALKLVAVAWVLLLVPSVRSEYCYVDYSLEYCEDGCCGDSYYDGYCCSDWTINVGAVVGGVIATLIIVGAIFIAIGYYKKTHNTRVSVSTNATANTTVAMSNSSGVYPVQPAPVTYSYPPGYVA